MAEYGSFGSGLAGGYLSSSKQRQDAEALQAKTDATELARNVEQSTVMMEKTVEVANAYRAAIARTAPGEKRTQLEGKLNSTLEMAGVLNKQLIAYTNGRIDYSSALAAGGDPALADPSPLVTHQEGITDEDTIRAGGPNLLTFEKKPVIKVVKGEVLQFDLDKPNDKGRVLFTSSVRDKPPIEVLQEAAATLPKGSKEYQQIQAQITKLGAQTPVAQSELGKAITEQSKFAPGTPNHKIYTDKIKKISTDTTASTPTDLAKLLEEQKKYKEGTPEHKLYQDKINILTTRKPTDPKIGDTEVKWVMIDGKPHKQKMRLAKPGEQGDEMGLVAYGDAVPASSTELGWIAQMMQGDGNLTDSLFNQTQPTTPTPTTTTPAPTTPAPSAASDVDVNQIVSDATETADAVASAETVNPDQRIQQAKVSALFGMGMNGWSNEQIADRLSEGEFTEAEITEILEYAMANLGMEPHPDLGLSFYEKIQWRDRNRKK
tara:strand:- start:2888 stop:4354 length:1467 start_codon:yes stop_codon:yes gene_type:complete